MNVVLVCNGPATADERDLVESALLRGRMTESDFAEAAALVAQQGHLSLLERDVFRLVNDLSGVAVPVVVGLTRGESPTSWQLAGIAVAVIGVVLASGPELSGEGAGGAKALLLAGAAAAGFGVVLLLVAQASKGDSGSVVMTLLTMRLTSVLMLTALLLSVVRRRGWDLHVGRSDALLILSIGVFDVAANGTYAVASRSSLVSVASVLASLYPVVTALLAYRVHGERLRRVQLVGGAAVGVPPAR